MVYKLYTKINQIINHIHQYRVYIRNNNQYRDNNNNQSRDNNNNNNNYHSPNNTTTNNEYVVLSIAVGSIGNTSGGTAEKIITFKKIPV